MIYQGIVTNEGLSKSIDVANNEGFQLTPYKFAVSEFIGDFDASRDINSLETTWYEGSISSFIKIDGSTIQFNCNIPAGTSPVPRFTKEVYVIATDGVDDFLLCFAQPTVELTYDPEAELRVRIQFKINNIEVADLYTFSYTQATEISDHNADVNAHPAIQEALKDFGIYVNSPNSFNGQYIDRFPVLGPSVTNNRAVYWSTITNRYELALATDPIAKNAIGVYVESRNTVVFGGVTQFTNGSPAYTKVYLSTLSPGLLTLSPSDTIIGYTLPNNRLLIDIEVAVNVLEIVDPDGNKAVQLTPPLDRELVLIDANDVTWEVTVANDGILSTSTTIKDITPVFKLTKPNLAFGQLKVNTDGSLFIEAPPIDNSILADDFYYIKSPDGTFWKMTLNLSNQVVMTTVNNTYSVIADNGAILFDVEQVDQYKAVQGASLIPVAELPSPLYAQGLNSKWAFADFGNNIIQPVYWDGSTWQVYGSGVIGDYKHSMLPEATFQMLNGGGWVQMKGQDISGSRFSQLTGRTRLPRAMGTAIRAVVDIADKQFQPNDIDLTNESVFISDGHEYETGDRVTVQSTTTLPAPLVGFPTATKTIAYYVIKIDDQNIKLATTITNAYANVAINLTSQGAGVHTLSQAIDASPRLDRNTGLNSNTSGTFQEDSIEYHTHADTAVRIYQDGIIDAVSQFATGNDADYSQTRLSSNGNIGKFANETRMMNISGYLYIKIN
jgi:hypothetical protein